MASKLKGKYDPDDLTPPGNLPDKSVIPPGKGMGDDVTELPYKPRKPDGSKYKYEPGKKNQTAPKEGRDYKLLRKGGSVGSASKRADGIAQKGKTRGRMV